MSREPACRAILKRELAALVSRPYAELAARVGEIETREYDIEGMKCQMELEIMWDSREGGDLRIFATMDDGGWRTFHPYTDSEFVPKPESREDSALL